jgi:hypothetical protein
VIAPTPAALVARLRRAPRPRVVGIAAGVAVVTLAGTFALQYRQARVELRQQRDALAAAESDLAALTADLDRTHDDTAQAERGTDLVGGNIDRAVADRIRLESEARDGVGLAAAADAARVETDAARLEVAANAAETQECFDGVAEAVGANRAGQGRSAVAALQRSSGPCTRTLAYATGARFPYDFADPYVLRAGGTYYGYSTNAGAGDIQVVRSTDLVSWELVGNALGTMPAWAAPNATWAPSVLHRDGRYVVYYTVRERASGQQCISRAVAASPAGPFHDLSRGPLICQHGDGGSIDPSPFVDGNRVFLLWKSEGRGSRPATLWSRELTADGIAFEPGSRATSLLAADRGFERGVIEAPTMLRSGNTWFLIYAAAGWSSRSYTTAYALCSGPAGPCHKPADNRLLRSGPELAGPGGVETFHDVEGRFWAAFHAYSEPNVGYPSSRYFHVAPVRITPTRPTIDTPT